MVFRERPFLVSKRHFHQFSPLLAQLELPQHAESLSASIQTLAVTTFVKANSIQFTFGEKNKVNPRMSKCFTPPLVLSNMIAAGYDWIELCYPYLFLGWLWLHFADLAQGVSKHWIGDPVSLSTRVLNPPSSQLRKVFAWMRTKKALKRSWVSDSYKTFWTIWYDLWQQIHKICPLTFP